MKVWCSVLRLASFEPEQGSEIAKSEVKPSISKELPQRALSVLSNRQLTIYLQKFKGQFEEGPMSRMRSK